MRRPTCAIASLLILASSRLGAPTIAQELTVVEANTPLRAVSKREAYVYASTPDGLFRASLAAQRWERLKTPPEMPPNGRFAKQPVLSPLIIYVVLRSRSMAEPPSRPGLRYGLYLSNDDGATWQLASERDDFGAVLHHPSGALFAVTGADGANHGSHLLRSPDLGKTWRDITGTIGGQFTSIDPDSAHPGLVRIEAWGIRDYLYEAEDESYQWKLAGDWATIAERRSRDEFFPRDSSAHNRFHSYSATLANYFGYDFGNQVRVQALEVAPLKPRYEFARWARVTVPVRVVFHFDPNVLWGERRRAGDEGRSVPRMPPPGERFADRPEGLDFWGLRVETSDSRVVKDPSGPLTMPTATTPDADGKPVASPSRPPVVRRRVFDLSPSSPYERQLDLDRIADFSKPGEYRVQILYASGGVSEADGDAWSGSFTSPVFTVVIRE